MLYSFIKPVNKQNICVFIPYHESRSMVATTLRRIEEMPSVGPRLGRYLQTAGYETIEDVATADIEDLREVPHVGENRARWMKEYANEAN